MASLMSMSFTYLDCVKKSGFSPGLYRAQESFSCYQKAAPEDTIFPEMRENKVDLPNVEDWVSAGIR